MKAFQENEIQASLKTFKVNTVCVLFSQSALLLWSLMALFYDNHSSSPLLNGAVFKLCQDVYVCDLWKCDWE